MRAEACPTHMRAAVVHGRKQPISIEQVPCPRPAAGEVVLKVRASGVCHTDIHAIDGDWPDPPAWPLVPGHEAVGEIVAVGAEVTQYQVGDRVGVPWIYSTCGQCEYCLSGWETLCPTQVHTGYDVPGGWADFMVAPASHLATIPAGIEWAHAAPLMCAGLTVYKGITVTDTRPGDWLTVSGIGGLGHLAVQYAKAMGLKVVAVDIDESKLDLASRLGADMTVNAARTEPGGYVQRQIGGTHGVLVTAVGCSAFSQALEIVRPGGTIALNGLPPGDFPIDIYSMVMRGITLRGSIVGTRRDMAKALEIAADKKIEPVVHRASLEDVDRIVRTLRSGSVPGRVVIELDQ